MRFQGYDMLLNECVNQRAIREGQRVHTHMIKTSYLPPVYLRTRLIIFYCKCETLGDARQVLDEMPERNVVSWTAMISAYSQTGYASEALNLFVQMLRSVMLLCNRMRNNKKYCFATHFLFSQIFNSLHIKQYYGGLSITLNVLRENQIGVFCIFPFFMLYYLFSLQRWIFLQVWSLMSSLSLLFLHLV